jgi:putative tributyrin esterase
MAWIRFQMNSQTVSMPVSFDALLPDNAENSKGKKWKTLYLLHGFGGDRNDWLLKARLAQLVRERLTGDCPLMTVLPEGQNSFFVNLPNGHEYADYLCRELPAFIEENFPVLSGVKNRFIAGMDMGGYGAFRQALGHPEVFGQAAAFEAPLDIFKYYQGLPDSMSFCMEHVFGREEKFRGGENDLFSLADRCAAKAEMPKLFLAGSRSGSFGQDHAVFSEHVKKLGFPGLTKVSLPEENWEFAESALKAMFLWLEEGGVQ